MAILLLPDPALFSADIPPNQTAGFEEARFKKEKEYEEENLNRERKQSETIKEKEEGPLGDETSRFELKAIEFSGNSKISDEDLHLLTAPLLNHEVSLREVQAAVSKIKEVYRSRGFIAAYCYIPPQKIKDGILKIQIVEGRFKRIEFSGNRWFSIHLLRKQFHLKPNEVLKYDDLRRDLYNLNKNRDISAKAVLKPGSEPESTDVEIQVKDKLPLHAGADVNNFGTRNTGKTRWGFSLADTNLTGNLDPLSARFQIGSHTWAVGTDYNIPISPWDTRLGFSYQRADVELGREFKDLDVKGSASTYSPYLIQPLIQKEKLESNLRTGFDFKSIENSVLGTVTGKDELRILNMGIDFVETDRWGKTFFPHSFNFGFSDFLGASDKTETSATRSGTGGQFFIYRTSLSRYERLPKDMMASLRSSVQLTPDRLAPSEALHLGGALSVRGYPEGEYLADNGAYFNSEIIVPSYFFPKDWKFPHSKDSLRNQIQGVGFFDFGGGSIKNSLATEEKYRVLAGVGGGIRIRLYEKVYARLEWAAPVASRSSESNSAFYFSIAAEAL